VRRLRHRIAYPAPPLTRAPVEITALVSHRWAALIVGLLVVVVSTSESNSELFRSTPAEHPVGFSEAVDAAGGMDP